MNNKSVIILVITEWHKNQAWI